MAARRREAAAGAQLLGGGGGERRRAVDGVLPAGAVAGRGGDGGGEGGEGEAARGGGRAGARRRGGLVERRCGRGGGAGRGVPRAPRHHGQWPRREVDPRALRCVLVCCGLSFAPVVVLQRGRLEVRSGAVREADAGQGDRAP